MPAPLLALTRLRTRAAVVRRAVLQRRRLLAVLLTVAAVAAGLRAAMPAEPVTVEVPVAAEALPSGTKLAPNDLAVVELPPEAAPDGAVEDAVGATLAGGVGRGEPITTARLLRDGPAAVPPGHTALPVRLSDAAQADLLRVGMHIDLLATDPKAGTTDTVAPEAVVLDTPAESEGGGAGSLSGRVVVLAVPEDLVAGITAATVSQYVTFAWSPV